MNTKNKPSRNCSSKRALNKIYLNSNTILSTSIRCSKPTVIKLKEFPEIGIHRHIFRLALFLKNWGGEKVTPSEAVDLIKQKFYQRPQRRDLQPREVENAVANAFDSSPIRRSPSRKVFIPKQVMTSADSLWPLCFACWRILFEDINLVFTLAFLPRNMSNSSYVSMRMFNCFTLIFHGFGINQICTLQSGNITPRLHRSVA